MSKVSGVISEVKVFDGKFGPMYNMTVNGTRYGTGKKKEGDVGDLVEFDAEQKGEFWNAKNVVNKGRPPAVEASAPKATSSGGVKYGNGGAYEERMPVEYVIQKDLRISRLSCRNAANDLVTKLLEHGLLPEPKAKNKNIVDVALEYSDLITNRLYDDVVNLGTKPKIEAKDTSPKDPDDELE